MIFLYKFVFGKMINFLISTPQSIDYTILSIENLRSFFRFFFFCELWPKEERNVEMHKIPNLNEELTSVSSMKPRNIKLN